MMNKTITLTRQELYDQVWSKPIIHLAKEYNLSDVGLAKLCRRHDIPLPPVGYWAKLAHGHKVEKLLLLPTKALITQQIVININEDSTSSETSHVIEEDLINKELGHDLITLSEFSKSFHRLIVEAQKEYRDRIKGYKNLSVGERIYTYNISVTKSSFDRATALMNMLFQSFEANGFSIKRTEGYKRQVLVTIYGIDVQVDIKERTKRAKNTDPNAYNKYSFLPTGILYFELVNMYGNDIKRIWSDSTTLKLEQLINEVASGAVIAAILRKKRNQEIEVEQKKAEDNKRLEQIQKEQERIERKKIDQLLEDSQKWNNINILRAYIGKIEKKYESIMPDDIRKNNIEKWIKWAKINADRLDPLLTNTDEWSR